jgi:hypothetical protein
VRNSLSRISALALRFKASRIAFSRASSLNGFVRNSTAPAFIA